MNIIYVSGFVQYSYFEESLSSFKHYHNLVKSFFLYLSKINIILKQTSTLRSRSAYQTMAE